MIQRIQSLWLLLAALVVAVLYKLPVYGGELVAGGNKELLVSGSFLLFIVAAELVVFPLVALFMFKNRSGQKKLIWISLLLQLVFVGLIWMEVSDFTAASAFKSSGYKPGAVLPIVAIVLLFMAYSGIRKDEKLIKSADKLR
ncbi:MAG TPA: DUF4293 domain-containing protein [Phnomibacter sp.]|nr:DUF4293 domain-containing protein [Phnomibacter sp.]